MFFLEQDIKELTDSVGTRIRTLNRNTKENSNKQLFQTENFTH